MKDRSRSLDALRGLAIVGMVFSSVIPTGKLPRWMYPAQVPPPDHLYDAALSGFTWVDLVFPMFLFALGVAIPLALGSRIARGFDFSQIVGKIASRFIWLIVFAVLLQHVRPQEPGNPVEILDWLHAVGGFVGLFLIFVRLPDEWADVRKAGLHIVGWITLAPILYFSTYANGSGFSIYRSDVVLLILANAVLFGGIVWYLTRDSIMVRLGLLALLIAERLAAGAGGWISDIWALSAADWIFRFEFLSYLIIVIPATVVGDWYVEWKNDLREPDDSTWVGRRIAAIVVLAMCVVGAVITGLQARMTWQTVVIVAAFCTPLFALVAQPKTATANYIRKMVLGAIFLTFVGLLLDPFEGGIKKDGPTLSYLFIGGGLSLFILIIFTTLLDLFRFGGGWEILTDNGMNPMIAYVGMMNLIAPGLALTGVKPVLEHYFDEVWPGLLLAVLCTLVLSLVVSGFTRLRLFWRT